MLISLPDLGMVRVHGTAVQRVAVAVVRHEVHLVVTAQLLRAHHEQRVIAAAHGGDRAAHFRAVDGRGHLGWTVSVLVGGDVRTARASTVLCGTLALVSPRSPRFPKIRPERTAADRSGNETSKADCVIHSARTSHTRPAGSHPQRPVGGTRAPREPWA